MNSFGKVAIIQKEKTERVEFEKGETVGTFINNVKRGNNVLQQLFYLQHNNEKILDYNKKLSDYGNNIKLFAKALDFPYFSFATNFPTFQYPFNKPNMNFESILQSLVEADIIEENTINFEFCGSHLKNDDYIIETSSSKENPIVVGGDFVFEYGKGDYSILIWAPVSITWTKLMHELLKKLPEIALHPNFQQNEPEFYSELIYHIGYDQINKFLIEFLSFVEVNENIEILIDKYPGFIPIRKVRNNTNNHGEDNTNSNKNGGKALGSNKAGSPVVPAIEANPGLQTLPNPIAKCINTKPNALSLLPKSKSEYKKAGNSINTKKDGHVKDCLPKAS
ncbi:hypothetical protein TVAG_274170 [Trichomonas vaginalis G3]|uniref:Uncharacterized protein n=1 Tax=Trichomonas vaginalis (strain ATCC PRA-98 / G3) TaxID=412133 RepID=A2GDB8_TRIV3|nr:hypothetical protein TVAGG3_0904990 [Trichomonas vaginalis G3]EAX84849.1 hypothetical protein TVAG_274170 [Trichomonas vaginalis G3]KAI5483984.1 hypothetical protein TVAGG3_0904990 [Trichomonas vaginalis G3]|eukprot:XP_001297779.1 hypothetical protein [Trichomonas vaginalis G3]